MRIPIRYQILWPFAGVMLLTLCGLTALNAYWAAGRVERQIDGELRRVADTIRDATYPLTESVLRQIHGLSGAELVLVSTDGTIESSTLAKSAIKISELTATVDAPQSTRPALVEMHHARYFHVPVPLAPHGRQKPGTLHVLYSEQSWRDARWEAAKPPVIVGAIALVLVGALSTAIATGLSRPVARLRQQFARLCEGHYEPIPLPKRQDEMWDLVAATNQLAAQLKSLRGIVERTERLALLGKLSGGLAHHLRNDVAGARMALQLHGRKCRDLDPQSLEVALRQLQLAEGALQRFLAVGQPAPPQKVTCSLSNIIEELLRLVGPSCKHKRVELRTRGPHDDRQLLADPEQLRQLLLNLVLNGVEAAGSGGWVELEVVPSSASAAPTSASAVSTSTSAVTIRVTDSGPGPVPDVVSRLFEPFVTSKPEGVGLGLAFAEQVAVGHGGSIGFAGYGPTCFEVSLPAQPQAASSPDIATDTKVNESAAMDPDSSAASRENSQEQYCA